MTTNPEGLREQIARIIDPESWRLRDREPSIPKHKNKSPTALDWERYRELGCRPSLSKADSIISGPLQEQLKGSSCTETASGAPSAALASETQRKSEDDDALTEAMAAVDRWLDREHHRFPSSPVSSSVATIYYALEARLRKEGSL